MHPDMAQNNARFFDEAVTFQLFPEMKAEKQNVRSFLRPVSWLRSGKAGQGRGSLAPALLR